MNIESVNDRTYRIDGKDYDRVTSIIGDTLGGQSPEAAACEVAKYAARLFTDHADGVIHQKPSRVWDGERFVEAFQDIVPSETLREYRAIQGEYWRIRQGWLDRGTILNKLFDALADEKIDPVPNHAYSFVEQELASCKSWTADGSPLCWQCDHDDVMQRAQWLARAWRQEKPVVPRTQYTVKCDRLNVAGTMDGVGVIGGTPGVIELKCGSEQFSHQVQASTYKRLAVGTKKMGVFLWYVQRDGYRIVALRDAQVKAGWETFKNLLPAYRALRTRRQWDTCAQDSDKKLEKRAS